MKQDIFNSDFNLSVKDYAAEHAPLHRHNYFELVYVLKGRGFHIINENQFAYGKEDLFLLTPTDSHTFLAHEASSFCVIDFTASFFGREVALNRDSRGPGIFFKQLEYIFQNGTKFKGYIKLNEEDSMFSGTLIRRMITEWDKKVFFRDIVLQNHVFLLLNIIAGHVETSIKDSLQIKPANKAYDMVAYIQHHIYDNDQLTIERLAFHFNLSKDYAGAYFKSHAGKPLKQFILDYKLALVKTRLLYSDLTITQIASELNFTDDSHLNKAFKNKYAMTANQYRKLQKI